MNQPSHTSCGQPDAGQPMRFRERVRQRCGEADLLVFRVGRERFAIELRSVLEVVEAPVLHPVPECDPSLRGVLALRELLLPVFSPERVLGVREQSEALALVLYQGAHRMALAVDDVDDVVRTELRALRDVPAGAAHDDVVAGLLLADGELITVLDARSLAAACGAPAGQEVA